MKYLMINTGMNEKLYSGAPIRRLELIKTLCLNTENQLILIGVVPLELKSCGNIQLIPCDFQRRGRWSLNVSALISIIKIRKKICAEKYDVAISWNPVFSIIMWISGIRNIVSCNRDDFYGYKRLIYPRRRDKGKLFIWWLIEGIELIISKKIIVQCRYDRNVLVKRHRFIERITKRCIDIQINNINASWMKYPNMIKKNNTSSEITIAFVSSFENGTSYAVSRKGNDILLPAVKKLIKEGYPIKLIVAGGGMMLEKQKEKYSAYPQMEFKGFCNVERIYEISDFAVFPSILDSCPNALLEALAMRVPVYGSRVSGIIDILEDDQFMFEPTEDSVYKKLKEIITDKSYLLDADKQISIVKKLTFDWGKEMKKLIDEVKDN